MALDPLQLLATSSELPDRAHHSLAASYRWHMGRECTGSSGAR